MRLQWGHCLPAWKFRNSCDDGNGNRFLLQWGHAFRQWKWRLAVESRTVWIASMGPPPSGSGILRAFAYDHVQVVTSMGPPPSGSGNQLLAQEPQHGLLTSMGPPPSGSGNSAPAPANFLAFRLQWGHRLPAVEMLSSSSSSSLIQCYFNGATAFRQWKFRSKQLATGSLPNFNGATAFRQWKFRARRRRSVRRSHFNGATAFRQWKSRIPSSPARPKGTSMGPPPSGSGNL